MACVHQSFSFLPLSGIMRPLYPSHSGNEKNDLSKNAWKTFATRSFASTFSSYAGKRLPLGRLFFGTLRIPYGFDKRPREAAKHLVAKVFLIIFFIPVIAQWPHGRRFAGVWSKPSKRKDKKKTINSIFDSLFPALRCWCGYNLWEDGFDWRAPWRRGDHYKERGL